MNKVIEQSDQWEFLNQLPKEVNGFTLTICKKQGLKYEIFCYEHVRLRRKVTAIYDPATQDYCCLLAVGLSEYYDAEFITPDVKRFEQVLAMRLRQYLTQLASFDRQALGSVFCAKNIHEWSYAATLPVVTEGFTLFIRPEQPVKAINGSYIILDYSDFAVNSHLIVYYNIYRDEFFAEFKLRGRPQTTTLFDARSLQELQTVLEKELLSSLRLLREEISRE